MKSCAFSREKIQMISLLIVLLLPLVAAAADGDIILTNDNMVFTPDILLTDSNGGIINVRGSAFNDGSGHIYAERFDNDGNPVWGWGGIVVSDAYNAYDPAATADMFGGVIVAYQSQSGIYAQRLNTNGTKMWNGGEGVLVLSGVSRFERPIIAPDGAGGAYIGYQDRFNHITYLGEVGDPGGNEYISANATRFNMVYDGQRVWDARAGWWRPGGVFLTWYDRSTNIIYAQHVKNGATQWLTDKVVAMAEPTLDFQDKRFYYVIRDGEWGMIVGWSHHPGTSTVVAVQRLDADGSRLWGANGVAVIDSSSVGGNWAGWYYNLDQLKLTSDGSGGAILAWVDYRNTVNYLGDSDIYCQRVDADGNLRWRANGIWVTHPEDTGDTPPNSGTELSPAMVSDGQGGAIIAVQDTGSDLSSHDIYVDRIDADGVTVWFQWAVQDDYDGGRGDQHSPVVVFDSTGPDPKGAIVAWQGDPDGDGFAPNAHKIEVSNTSPFDNDLIADAYLLTTYSASPKTIGSLYWATNDVNSACGGDTAGQPDVWYRFTAPESGVFRVDTCGTNDLFGVDSSVDTVLSLYNVTPHGIASELICNDDAFRLGCPDRKDSTLAWIMGGGETIYVRVSRRDATTNGMFKLGWAFTLQFFGDADSDDDVDGEDLADLAGEFDLACESGCETDFNGDGTVDNSDLFLLADNFGHLGSQ